MFNAKKIITAFAVALIASLGAAIPAEAAPPTMTRMADSWCC